MKAPLATLAAVLLVTVVVVLLDGRPHDQPMAPTTSGSVEGRLRPVPASPLTATQINRQDPPDPQRELDEARAFDRRPLLNALPTTLQGVRFDIGGLGADDKTTIITADAQGLGTRRARIAYETLLRRTDDRSSSYRLRLQP